MKPSTTIGMGLLAASLVIGGCSGDDDAASSPTESTTTLTESNGADTTGGGTDSSTTTGDPGPGVGDDDATAVISAGDATLSDGVWAVGDAGSVEFVLRDGQLELVDVVANDGWRVTVDEQSADEIEVDFARDNLEYEIEIEYENGILEIEIDLDIDPADPGTFEIGPAGTATLAIIDGRAALDELVVSDGWTVVEQDTDDGEVEIELRRDNVTWELDAEVDDGRLEVEIDFEIEGRFS